MQADWGLPTTGVIEPAYCWGARAIWSRGSMLDILWDRQGWAGEGTAAERQALANWFNDKGRAAMDRRLAALGLDGSSEDRAVVAGDGYRLTGTPNGSYGYVYLVCEPDPDATGTVELPPKTKPKAKRRPRTACKLTNSEAEGIIAAVFGASGWNQRERPALSHGELNDGQHSERARLTSRAAFEEQCRQWIDSFT
jgi:hypothetical protein